MPTTVRGILSGILQREEWDFDPVRGYLHRQFYKGASQSLMLALQQDYVRQGIGCRLVYEQGDTAVLDVNDSTYSYLIDSWEIVANAESRDGFSHPKLINTATAVQIAKMRELLEQNDDFNTAFADPVLANLANTIAPGFYILQQNGQENYRRGQYVLRHKTNAPNRWSANIADVGIARIYTTAQLLAETTSSALWVYPLPARLQYKISQIPVPNAQTDYLWGWLKDASTETTAPNNRIEITTDYTLEQWSLIYYDPY